MKLEEFHSLSVKEQRQILQNLSVLNIQENTQANTLSDSQQLLAFAPSTFEVDSKVSTPSASSSPKIQTKRELKSPHTPFRGGSKKVKSM